MSNAWNGADPTQSSDSGSYSLGATFTANDAITVTGIRVWAGATPGVRANRKGRLWATNSESQLAIASLPDTLPSGWSAYDFTAPVDLTIGQTCTIAWDTGGFYGELNAAFDSAVTSGDGAVTFLAGGSAPHGNGSFTTSVGSFPDVASSQHTFYGADIVYTVTGGDTPPTITGMSAVVAGDLVTSVINAVDNEGLTGATYAWDWGDGTNSSGSANTAQHTYTTPGQYAILGTVTDSGGLSASAARPVTIVSAAAGFNAAEVQSLLTSMALESGLFRSVSGHEPASPPQTGLTAALWLQSIGPSARFSGLSASAGAVNWILRIYNPMTTGNLDDVDPAVGNATATMIGLFSGDFTLGGAVFAVDLLGMNGMPLAGKAGYLNQTERIMDIVIPLVIDNVWAQEAVS